MHKYWSGLPFPPPGDLPDPGIEPTSLVSPPLAGGCSNDFLSRLLTPQSPLLFSVSLQVINSLKTEAGFFFFFLLPIISEPSRDSGAQ